MNIARAQTMANANRTKYSRRSADAVAEMPGEAAMALMGDPLDGRQNVLSRRSLAIQLETVKTERSTY
ncbi:hypothetical protein HerbRD11066_27740 [Herbidospora sp. RD11066]